MCRQYYIGSTTQLARTSSLCTSHLSWCSQALREEFSVIWEIQQLGRITVLLNDK